MIFSLAWKNVWRNKTRSLIVIIAVTLGIWAGVFSSAVMNGMSEQRLYSAIHNEVAHIQIHHPKFSQNQDIQFAIDNAEKKLEAIEAIPEVKAATQRMKFTAMAKTSETGAGIQLYGVYPEKEKQVFELYKLVCDSNSVVKENKFTDPKEISTYLADSCGGYFHKDRRNAIVIGRELAEKLDVRVRSKIVITLQGADGNLVGGAFKVVGIYETNNSTYDKMNVFVRAEDIARITGFDQSKCHEIDVLLYELEADHKVEQVLKSMYPDLKISLWKNIQPDLGMMNEFIMTMLYVVIIIILLALGFGIVNTMLMVVMERVKEIGMLMAIGMNKIKVFTMIMLESVYLTLTGSIVGMLLSAFIVWLTGKSGINISQFAEGLESVGYAAVIYPEIGLDFYIGVTILVIITGILASLYPARKALKLNPADALRIE